MEDCEANKKVQPKLMRFFKRPADLTPEDLEKVTVQAVSSKWRRVEHPIEEQPARSEKCLPLASAAPLEQVEASLVAAAKLRMNKGGRPCKPAEILRGKYGGQSKSNRLQHGEPRRRQDILPHAGLAICRYMDTAKGYHGDEVSWQRTCMKKYLPMPWKTLKNVHSKGIAFWESKVRDSVCGVGSRGSLNKNGQSKKTSLRESSARGSRAKGAGRPDHFKHFKEALKIWVKLERENSHAIDGYDMAEEFMHIVQKAVTYGTAMVIKGALSPGGAALLLEYKARLVMLKKKDYKKEYVKSLMRFCGVSYLKPQRMLSLTYEEEKIRCRLTWMQFDKRMYDLACGDVNVLKKYVVDANIMLKRIEDCVMCFSDQVPWWGMICRKKQMYLKDELAGSGMTQKRGWDNEEGMKFRITVELRQVILNYFKTGDKPADPEGILGDSLVIVAGVHCRLNNISEDGKWITTEKFIVGGKEKIHFAGKSVGNVMVAWRKLRTERPYLFEGISLMQQPAAVVDSVITTWTIMEMALKYPCMLWQRDLSGGGGFSLQAKQAMKIAGQVPSWIAGKMTAVLQITDTDQAYLMKCYAEEVKREVRLELEAVAAQAHKEVSLKCGAFEIMQIIAGALKKLKDTTIQKNVVLAAARRNGILAYRPDMKEKKLVDCSDQPWCRDLPRCGASHRLQKGWVEDRMKWRDAEGKPLEPNWGDSTLVKTMEDMLDNDAVATALEVVPVAEGGFQGPTVKVGGEKYDIIQVALPMFESIADDLKTDMERAVYLQRSVKERLLEMQVDERRLAEAMTERPNKVKDRALKKALRGRQVAAYLQNWSGAKRKEMEEHGVSREEMLEGLVPTAGLANKACKDPALKALEDFLKIHKTLEVAKGKVVSRWVFCGGPSKGPWSRELAAKKLAPSPPPGFSKSKTTRSLSISYYRNDDLSIKIDRGKGVAVREGGKE